MKRMLSTTKVCMLWIHAAADSKLLWLDPDADSGQTVVVT